MIRAGLGWDLHRLVEGRPLIIGGVTIPFDKGEAGHSDGDVLLHAIIDALLGAAAMGDIGEFFPPSDNRWKDVSSIDLLLQVREKLYASGWTIENIDCVIALETPKFLPWREAVRQKIAEALHIGLDQVFVKAKTGEGLAPIGTSEAVSAQASCLLSR